MRRPPQPDGGPDEATGATKGATPPSVPLCEGMAQVERMPADRRGAPAALVTSLATESGAGSVALVLPGGAAETPFSDRRSTEAVGRMHRRIAVAGLLVALAFGACGAPEEEPATVVPAASVEDELPMATTTEPPPTTTAAPMTAPPSTAAPPTTVRAFVATTAPPAPAATQPPPTAAPSTYYKNCTDARNAGAAPVRRGDPGYGSHLDRDGDGIGCE